MSTEAELARLRPTEGARFLLERETVEADGSAARYRAWVIVPDARWAYHAALTAGAEPQVAADADAAPAELEAALTMIARLTARAAAKKDDDGLAPWPHRVLRWRGPGRGGLAATGSQLTAPRDRSTLPAASMSTISISYSAEGFNPSAAAADPGDEVTVTNTTKSDITLSFACGSVKEPLTNITSPVTVPGNGGVVSGDVRNPASNQTITFTADGAQCTVAVGPAKHQITVSPTSSSPPSLDVNPADVVRFYNESDTTAVTLRIESLVPDPFGPEVGQEPTLAPLGDVSGAVERAAKGTKVKVTVKGSTTATTVIDVGSGDTDTALAAAPAAAPAHCG